MSSGRSERDPISILTSQLARLPGIGQRTATRLVFHLLRGDRAVMTALGEALAQVADNVYECDRCCTLTAKRIEGVCPQCRDERRDATQLCVVATIQDQAALEATGDYMGRYHVLHGTLSPLDGIGPQDLRIQSLLARLSGRDRGVKEIILATPPTVDGEATALYLARQLEIPGLKVTRIASGIPVGGDLSYADKLTLSRALTSRTALSSGD